MCDVGLQSLGWKKKKKKSGISQATNLLHTHQPAAAVLWHLKEALGCKSLLGLWRTSGSFPVHICEP